MPKPTEPETNKQPSAYETAIAKPTEAETDAFVMRYIATMHAGVEYEIATLAAAMAPRAKAFDPAALTAQAIALREEAALSVQARRAALLAGADYYSLSDLYWKLAAGKSETEQKRDPHLAAINEAKKATNAEHSRLWHEDPQRAIESAARDALLESVAKESGPMPSLPCSVETALRWSLSAPAQMPWDKIEPAFIEFLAFYGARDQQQKDISPDHPDGRRRQYSGDWIKRLESFLMSPSLTPDSRLDYEKELAKYREAIADLDALAAYVTEFKPGIPAPNGISESAKSIYAEHWQRKGIDQTNLLFLASDFREFWRQHGYAEEWKRIRDGRSRGAKITNAKRKEAAIRRDPQRWTDETILDLVKEFTRKLPAKRRTLESARAFKVKGRDAKDCGEILGTLYILRDKPEADAIAAAKQTLALAQWRAAPETASGSTAGTAKRKKSGRMRAGHKGIEVSEECLMECFRALGC